MSGSSTSGGTLKSECSASSAACACWPVAGRVDDESPCVAEILSRCLLRGGSGEIEDVGRLKGLTTLNWMGLWDCADSALLTGNGYGGHCRLVGTERHTTTKLYP